MVKLIKIDGTVIIGAILLSTIEQVKFLGSIGEEVLKKFKIKEVDSTKFYPRAIRGNIHQNVLNNYTTLLHMQKDRRERLRQQTDTFLID